ncbi:MULTISPECIES: hypothetical protein [unclassified Francisella]|uniref:hypothetical protein n=1 Tax=unclassified Francisella TaxID=2610885 RepID=UPI002E33A0A6|nr:MULTISPECIES: hypothetical protein [unclassified Francisella]MED7818650.1 hypothetical protein [Francisella sp. 19S2-4]MED7829486.1 hypothetical protein [Francisella sp. 19S2-10]
MEKEEYQKMLLEFYKENSKFMEKLIPSSSLIVVGLFVSKLEMIQNLSCCYLKILFLLCIFCFIATIVISVYTIIKSQKIINEVYDSLENERFRVIEIMEATYRWFFILSLIFSFIFIVIIVVGG